jgi:hypothetical protein
MYKPYISHAQFIRSKAKVSTWTKGKIDDMAEQCAQGKLKGTYGENITNTLVEGLKRMHLKGTSVLVIGSQNPWVEACALSLGAAKITTIEYGAINSTHPQMQTLTPSQLPFKPGALFGQV